MNLLASMRYLVALDEHRHFGRAAKACHITQPALSNALKALEEEFGVAIVKRSRNFEGLTPEGESVLAAAQRMLHERELLAQELSSDATRPRGPLRMGAVPTAVPVLARFAAMLQARHPGIAPLVLSMSSSQLERGIENLSLDLALGYTERAQSGKAPAQKLQTLPQYHEHYFLLRRSAKPAKDGLRMGPKTTWKKAAALPLALLTPEMHNRSIVDAAFLAAGTPVQPVLETNSMLTLALAVVAGQVCSILPGALVGVVRGYRELEAQPLAEPAVLTPIGFMTQGGVRSSRALDAALALAQDPEWLRQVAAHSGLLAA
jgi:DNA-binding transcriptional LysR family regulator